MPGQPQLHRVNHKTTPNAHKEWKKEEERQIDFVIWKLVQKKCTKGELYNGYKLIELDFQPEARRNALVLEAAKRHNFRAFQHRTSPCYYALVWDMAKASADIHASYKPILNPGRLWLKLVYLLVVIYLLCYGICLYWGEGSRGGCVW